MGGLQPTRSIGDLRLKHDEFNSHNYRYSQMGYKNPIPDFNGPYINYEPDIQVFDLTSADKFIILATDGLWDNIKRKQAATIVKESTDNAKLSNENIMMSLYNRSME